MIGLLLAAAALAGGGYAIGRTSSWRLAYAHASRRVEEQARNLSRNSIVRLAVLGPDGQRGTIEVTVVGLPGDVPGVDYTGAVTGAQGTTFQEGTFLQFSYLHVAQVDA